MLPRTMINDVLNRFDIPLWPHAMLGSLLIGVVASIGLFLLGV